MRTFTFCTLASLAVLSSAITAKALTSSHQHAALTDVSATAASRTALGPAIPLAHGLVQVQVTSVGTRIMDIVAVQLPHDNNHSWDDSLHAAAVLRSEILSKQRTDVDVVSGATYTSEGYLESLNAALDVAVPNAPKMSPTPMS
ncbi:FMN-binding protein [Actinospica sp.]|jgi:uncharacterized protein with FMN-binding domain|uniref:FMN-binding protein n=1 Tax=Actinospica sp. TaxID=1872142 RepID=UPI002BA12B80|nr:FMN-binding protein [Actinospica sp.]HWG28092.1 FMN-binding protein [Actinospica sp.]